MSINISTAAEIVKLLAFIRASAKATFDINPELVAECIQEVARFAAETGVTIDVVTPTGEKIVTCTGAGVLVGAAAGLLLAGLPGACLGAVVGGVAGYAAAHITILLNWSAQTGGPAQLHLI